MKRTLSLSIITIALCSAGFAAQANNDRMTTLQKGNHNEVDYYSEGGNRVNYTQKGDQNLIVTDKFIGKGNKGDFTQKGDWNRIDVNGETDPHNAIGNNNRFDIEQKSPARGKFASEDSAQSHTINLSGNGNVVKSKQVFERGDLSNTVYINSVEGSTANTFITTQKGDGNKLTYAADKYFTESVHNGLRWPPDYDMGGMSPVASSNTRLVIDQFGRSNQTVIHNDGNSNTFVSVQNGDLNQQAIINSGNNNRFVTSQKGNENSINGPELLMGIDFESRYLPDDYTYVPMLGASGNGNRVVIDQNGDGNEVFNAVGGNNNVVNFRQAQGDINSIELLMSGNNNRAVIDQIGSDNEVSGKCDSPAMMVGNSNTLLVDQIGSHNKVYSMQYGNGNRANIVQNGDYNTVTNHQGVAQ